MRLYVTLYRGQEGQRPFCSFEREVSWCSLPRSEMLFFGKNESGKNDSVYFWVKNSYFTTDGITIEAVRSRVGDEYESIKESLLRDGFTPKYDFPGDPP